MSGDEWSESREGLQNGGSIRPEDNVQIESKQNARKKKKKKKKKGYAGDASTLKVVLQPRKELEARFGQALTDIRRDDPNCVWSQLDNCNIHDAKACTLAAALENNKELTSLDLSSNSISTRGVEAIAKALEGGAAPHLILLNLRGNPLGPEASDLVEKLKKSRKELKIDLAGSPVSSANDTAADPDGHEMLEVKASPHKQHGLPFWMSAQDSEAANGNAWSDAGSTEGPSDEEASAACWTQIKACLRADSVDQRELASDLRAVSVGVRKEMVEAKAPLPKKTKLDQLRPFTQSTVKNLADLANVLELSASPVVTPFSKEVPVPAAGLHCALVSQIAEQLLSGLCASINVHVLKAGLIPRLAYMALEFPKNNILQSATSKAIRWAVQSGLKLLWEPLFKPRMGLSKGSQLRRGNLVERLVAILGRSEKAQSVGRRECDVGFACSVAECLLSTAETDSQLLECMKESKGWDELTAGEGVLQKLLAEQKDELCGPRPQRPALGQLGDSAAPDDFQPPMQGSDFMQLLQQSFEGNHIQDPSEGDTEYDSDEETEDVSGQDQGL